MIVQWDRFKERIDTHTEKENSAKVSSSNILDEYEWYEFVLRIRHLRRVSTRTTTAEPWKYLKTVVFFTGWSADPGEYLSSTSDTETTTISATEYETVCLLLHIIEKNVSSEENSRERYTSWPFVLNALSSVRPTSMCVKRLDRKRNRLGYRRRMICLLCLSCRRRWIQMIVFLALSMTRRFDLF